MPSFKLFCTEAFQFDYEAPFHRAWMLHAIQNEIEPLVDWLVSSPPRVSSAGALGDSKGNAGPLCPCATLFSRVAGEMLRETGAWIAC